MDKWIETHIADDYVNHSPSFGVSPDKDGLKQMFRNLIELVPNVQLSMKEMIFENNLLCFRFGTGLPGSERETHGLAMAQFNDKKLITQRWAFLDSESGLTQASASRK